MNAIIWPPQSFIELFLDDEFSTLNANINGTHFVLAALKRLAPECRFYFAGSSEMFGQADQVPQNEATRFQPRSSLRHQRSHQLWYLTRGCLAKHLNFTHQEDSLQSRIYHSGLSHNRKIASAVARILAGKTKELRLGNIEPEPQLGPCPRLRASHVADAATAFAR